MKVVNVLNLLRLLIYIYMYIHECSKIIEKICKFRRVFCIFQRFGISKITPIAGKSGFFWFQDFEVAKSSVWFLHISELNLGLRMKTQKMRQLGSLK